MYTGVRPSWYRRGSMEVYKHIIFVMCTRYQTTAHNSVICIARIGIHLALRLFRLDENNLREKVSASKRLFEINVISIIKQNNLFLHLRIVQSLKLVLPFHLSV